MSSKAPRPAEERDAYKILNELRQTKLDADFYTAGLQNHISTIRKASEYPNLRDEEQKLLDEYQDYLEGIRMQQDKILRTVTYPQTLKEVSAHKIERRTSEQFQLDIIARNRQTDENNDTEEPITYTLRLQPRLYSYRQLIDSNDAA